MKKLFFLFPLMALFSQAKAYRIAWGQNYVLSQPIHEDLYVAGGNVTINAPVYGDLIVAGGTINLNDTIINDVLLAGGKVYIKGYVGDDIRCAGGELHILNNIGGDLVITGGSVEIAKGVTITGGLILGGGEVVVNGTVNGLVKSTSANMTFNGIANNGMDFRGDKLLINGAVHGPSVIAARSVQIGNDALFYDNVRFWNTTGSVDFKQSLKNGTAVYDLSLRIKGAHWYYIGNASLVGALVYTLTVFLLLVLLQYLFSNTLRRAGNTIDHAVIKSLGWGFLFIIGVPLAVLLLLVTIIGIPIGLLLMFAYISILVLATIITALVVANWYNIRYERSWNFWQTTLAALGLFILLKIVSFTPFLGWLIMAVIAFTAFGSILRNVHWRRSPGVPVS